MAGNKENNSDFFIEKLSSLEEVDKTKLKLQIDAIGLYTELCLSTNLFSRNSELKEFNDSLFLGIIDTPFLDYLYKSRTQLLARGIREIYLLDMYNLKLVYARLNEFVYSRKITNTDNTDDEEYEDEDDFLNYWSKVIDGKGV